MKIKELFNLSLNKIKSSAANIIVLSLICGVFTAALFYIDMFLGGFTPIFVILLILPFFFATIMSFRNLKHINEISGRGLFAYFFLYFRAPFSSSFRVIRSFLKTFLISTLSEIVVLIIVYFIFKGIDPAFSNNIAALIEQFTTNPEDTDAINALLVDSVLHFYFISLIVGSFLSAFIFFIFISYESISIYYKADQPNHHVRLYNYVVTSAIKKNRKEYNKYFWGLNWPMFVLMIIGGALGILISYNIYGFDTLAVTSIGLAGMFLGATIYLPFFLANLESIYTVFSSHFEEAKIELGEKIKRQALDFIQHMKETHGSDFFDENSGNPSKNEDNVIDVDDIDNANNNE
jgi:hypothetical protein